MKRYRQTSIKTNDKDIRPPYQSNMKKMAGP